MALSADKKRLSIESGSGITPWEVAQCIDDYRLTSIGRNVGLLCTSPNINKWAKNKPFESTSYDVQTSNDRKNSAWGFYWGTEDGAPFATTAEQLWNRAFENNFDWHYKKAQSVMRLSDFDLYNHAAKQPYIYSKNSNISANSNVMLTITRSSDENGEIKLSDFPTSNISDWYIAAICASNDNRYIRYAVSDDTVSYLDNGGTASITIDASDPYQSNVGNISRIIIVATNNDLNQWVYFPQSLIKVVKEGTGVSMEYADDSALHTGFMAYVEEGFSAYPDTTHNIKSIKLDLSFFNEINSIANCYFTVNMWTDEKSAVTIGPELIIDPMSQQFVYGIRCDISALEATPNNIYITLTYEYTINGTTSYRYFDFINNHSVEGEASESDGVTLSQIIEKRISDKKYEF